MKCLLCQQPMKSKVRAGSLVTFEKTKEDVCISCKDNYQLIPENHCPTCFKIQSTEVCTDCLYWEKQGHCVNHSSLYQYNEAMKDYFKAYKFSGDYVLKAVFVKEIQEALHSYQKDYQVIPVPVSRETYKDRGFNQVVAFLDEAGIVCDDIVEKEETAKQSSKTRQERLKTPQVFRLKKDGHLKKQVLVVDDIYTTGATIQLLTRLLRGNGVEIIKSFSLAR